MPTIAEAAAKRLTWQNYGIIMTSPTPRGLLKQANDLQSDFDYAPLTFQATAKRRFVTVFDQPHVVLAAGRHGVLEEATRFALFMAGDFVGDLFMKLLPTQWPSRKSVLSSPQFLVNPPRSSRRAGRRAEVRSCAQLPALPLRGGVADGLAAPPRQRLARRRVYAPRGGATDDRRGRRRAEQAPLGQTRCTVHRT